METPDPPSDTLGALKQVVLTPHDIPWSLRVVFFFATDFCKIRRGFFVVKLLDHVFLNFEEKIPHKILNTQVFRHISH